MRDFTKVPLLITFGVPIIFYHKRNNGSHDLWKQQFRSQASFFLGHEHFLKEMTMHSCCSQVKQPLCFAWKDTWKRHERAHLMTHSNVSDIRKPFPS